MRRFLGVLLPALFFASLMALRGAGTAEGEEKKAAGKNHKVEMRDNVFKPVTITITAGDTITWVNKGGNTHTATGQGFNTGDVASGKSSKPVKFTKAGTIQYRCKHHKGMQGKIIVKAKA
jgi:plastocyanin